MIPRFMIPKPALFCILLLILVGFSCVAKQLPAQGPENTLVVVNAESSDSLAIANRYISLRDIPAVNVVYLKGVPEAEGWNSPAFKKKILKPMLDAMKQRGIEDQIDCVAYSAGIPTRISVQPELKIYLEQAGIKYNFSQHNPWASITSLTYFYRNAFSKTPTFLALDANRYANPRRMRVLANPFTGSDAAKYDAAIKKMNAGDYDAANKSFIELGRKHRHQVSVVFAFARCLALNGENANAIVALKHLKSLGFAYRSLLTDDKAFFGLKSELEFREIIKQMDDLPDGLTATRSFSSQYRWAKNGWRNDTKDQGERYLLSSVLAVTGEKQSTLEASLARLESSVGADGTAPVGNVYFADHKDARSRTRKNQFRFAAAELEAMGRSALIGSAIYPKSDRKVIGVTMGSSKPDWSKSNSKFLPGAICDNFTSYGAWWGKGGGQTQISEFLDAGAAGASGTVCEPFTIPAKIPTARWHAHYARGATLAESFFQSVTGPFQLLLVGDPLCCPFGQFPEFKLEGLEDGATIDSDFVLQVKRRPGSPAVERYEMYYDGVFLDEIPNPKKITVAIDGMNDGYHEIRVVAISKSAVTSKTSEAISFLVNPSAQELKIVIPQTRVKLGDQLQVQIVYSGKGEVQIYQNSRPVGKVEQDGNATISTARIGAGLSNLQAVTVLDNGTLVRSPPVTVEVIQ